MRIRRIILRRISIPPHLKLQTTLTVQFHASIPHFGAPSTPPAATLFTTPETASRISRILKMVTVMGSGSNLPKFKSGTNDSSVNILANKGSISRTGSGFSTAPSRPSTAAERYMSCTTFNILAPIYKRLDQQNQSIRESDFRAFWLARNRRILNWLLFERSSIICLQEFWVGNEELVEMYEGGLANAGYVHFKLGRSNNRGDGLLTAIHKDHFRVLNYRDLFFNDFGDRVAQLLHVQSVLPLLPNHRNNSRKEVIIVNTHLLFPHDSSLSIVRLHQVYKLLQYVESYLRGNKLGPLPIILCGDWNGSKRGHVYKFLRSQGFISSYDAAHQYTDSDLDAHRWISHRNHRGNICGVDFIWLCNPDKQRRSLKKSWAEAVFGILKYQLKKASLAENDAFAFLKADNHGDIITKPTFCEALRQLNLTGATYGLSYQEINDLWAAADTDGNGVVDFNEFTQKIWNSSCLAQEEENTDENMEHCKQSMEVVGFKVRDAAFFPREAEKGMWPENYSLSDHARLTVVFSPIRMVCNEADTVKQLK